jgi:hypothetical protein
LHASDRKKNRYSFIAFTTAFTHRPSALRVGKSSPISSRVGKTQAHPTSLADPDRRDENEEVRARARASSCPFCAAGLGWLRAHSLLGVCGGGVWRPLSFASGVGQGRLGVVGCLDRHLLLPFPHHFGYQYRVQATVLQYDTWAPNENTMLHACNQCLNHGCKRWHAYTLYAPA